MASSYVLTETSKKGRERRNKAHSIFSTHLCVSQPRFYESPDGEFISAGKYFEAGPLAGEMAAELPKGALPVLEGDSRKPLSKLKSLPPCAGEVAAKPT